MCKLDDRLLKSILNRVNKPAQYIGNELNVRGDKSIYKPVKFLLSYPDFYEIGMSNLSLRILYALLDNMEDVFVDRVFFPGMDMYSILINEKIPLFSLGKHLFVHSFDIWGITLQHELTFTNIVHMLKLANMPVYSVDRLDDDSPIVFGGGPVAFNPEPVADFFDMFFIGEIEETLQRVINIYKASRNKRDFLNRVSNIDGIYIPSKYEIHYKDNTIIPSTLPKRVKRVWVSNLDNIPINEKEIVPLIEIVHDRAMIEIQRGCDYGCRFCMAGFIYRPRRERRKETILKVAFSILANTGWEEISLVSLSSLCHSQIYEIIDELYPVLEERSINLGLPSLRLNDKGILIFKRISKLKKMGITLVPEAGSEFIRRFINKNVTDDEILNATEWLTRNGWQKIKLYFIIGFSPEGEEDIKAIADFALRVREIGKRNQKRFKLTVSVSNFVPKPHTPLQWEAFQDINILETKQEMIKGYLKGSGIKVNFHDVKVSWLEAIMSRGDRRLSRVIEIAANNGAMLDSWGDFFNFNTWYNAFKMADLNPSLYLRERDINEVLPWDFIDVGFRKDYLIKERDMAYRFSINKGCFKGCKACGIC